MYRTDINAGKRCSKVKVSCQGILNSRDGAIRPRYHISQLPEYFLPNCQQIVPLGLIAGID